MAAYVVPLLWGLAVLAAFIGWGGVVGRLFAGRDAAPADWGLAAGWGMAAALAAGGVLALVGLARPLVLAALVIIGAVLFARDALAAAPPRPAARRLWSMVALALVPLATRYAGAVNFQAFSCGDDNLAYFAFVARLLDTGTLIEPFSLRRLSAYGGQTFLQALVMVAGDENNGYLLDRGIAFVVGFGLALGLFRDPDRSGAGGLGAEHYLMALLLTVVLPLPLLNSSSHVSGLAIALTLFRTLERSAAGDGAAAPRACWLIGLIVAGAASLKATSLVMAAAALAAWWLIGVWRRPGEARHHAVAAAHLALSTLAFLGAWMALLYRSSGTPVFPLVQGTHQPAFAATYSGGMPAGELVRFVLDFALEPRVGLFLAPVLIYAFRRGNRAGLALYAGAIVTTLATVTTLIYDDLTALHRYVAPFVNAAFIATAAVLADELFRATPAADRPRRRRVALAVLWGLVIALLPIPIYHDVTRVAGSWGETLLSDDNRAVYARLQAAVPAGEKLMLVVNHPFAFDYARNPIVNIDVPGGASPAPGMPMFKGPEPLKAYLLAQSIRHVVFRDFAAPGGCLYGRDVWLKHVDGDNPMWRAQSRYFLDLMDNVFALKAGARILLAERGVTAMALD